MRNSVKNTTVSDIRELLVQKATSVYENDSVYTVIDKLLENPISRHVYVTDENNKMVGSIRMNNLIEYIFPFETYWLKKNYDDYIEVFYRETAGEIMTKDFVYVKNETTLGEMVLIMDKTKINEMPVLDNENNICGEVNFLEVLRFIQSRNRQGMEEIIENRRMEQLISSRLSELKENAKQMEEV